ncbi:MAG: cupin domain-containing protein [Hyphomonas sp.]|nr:cupin domain-containing protein [Hyphomonas sp.]
MHRTAISLVALCGFANLGAMAEDATIASAVAAPPPAEAADALPGDAPTVFAWDDMAFTDTDVGRRVQLMDQASRTLDQLEIHITTLNAGESSHAPHRHPNEEVVVLMEGTLEAYVNGVTETVGPGSVLVFLSNDWHGVRNVGDGPATYQVINFRTGME